LIRTTVNLFIHFWKNRFFRFLFIGGVNTLFGYSVFSLLVFIKIHYTLALLISTILGVLFNFKTVGIIVFKDGKNSNVFKFITVYVVLYFLNLAIIACLKKININLYAAGAAAILPVAVTGYFLNKIFVFNDSAG